MRGVALLLCLGLAVDWGCTAPTVAQSKAGAAGSRIGIGIVIPPGSDIADFVARHPREHEFLLETGAYGAGSGACLMWNHLVIRRKSPGDKPRITQVIQLCGDDNILDGLEWDADKDDSIRRSDPATLAIGGKRNIVRHCVFRNFRTKSSGLKIVVLGRYMADGQFINSVADDNTIDSCIFDNWGLRGQPKGSTWSSACIAVGREDDKGKFTGTVIRKNLFINGPYKEYGYNAACKIFNATLLEGNVFFGGQECMEMKYGNCTVRGNVIHHFSGYSLLGDRYLRNNLYEYNTVYDVTPIDSLSSAQGFMVWECGNTVFRNNLIYDCHTTGRITGRETSTPHNRIMEYLLIENNTFVNNKRGIVFENKHGGPMHVFITRNIFCNREGLMAWPLSGVDTASLDYFADNLYYGPYRPVFDKAPVRENPRFIDTADGNFHLAEHSPACGYGAFSCGKDSDTMYGLAHYVVVYPTMDKWFFHVGLAGLDVQPEKLEVDDAFGNVVASKSAPEAGYKLFSNIDLRESRRRDYVMKMETDKGVIIKKIHIE